MSDPATRASVGRQLTEAVHKTMSRYGIKAPGLRVVVAGPRVVVSYRRGSTTLPIVPTGMVFIAALDLIQQQNLTGITVFDPEEQDN